MKSLIALSGLGLLSLFSEIFRFKRLLRPLVLIGLAICTGLLVSEWNSPGTYFKGMYVVDHFSIAFGVLMTAITLCWFLLSSSFFSSESNAVDRSALVVFSLIGALCMASFANLIMLFLGIEILSVSLYVLAGSEKSNLASNESALKYFLMGAFATGFLLFGIAMVYGATGSFDLVAIAEAVSAIGSSQSPLLITGLFMMLIAMTFKVAGAPFHYWAPDVYQGAPTPVTAFMSTVVKTAAFAAFFRLFQTAFVSISGEWAQTLSVIAGLSILLGNLSAVAQTNIKRMLAYSSIAHAGYMLMAVVSMSAVAQGSLFFYATTYAVSSLSAFFILLIISNKTGTETTDGFRGLARKNPMLAILTIAAMLSLAGIPPTGGFFAKYYIFTSSLDAGQLPLVLIAVAGSLVGVYYYFRPLMALFSQPDDKPVTTAPVETIVLICLSLVGLALGVAPAFMAGLLS